MVVPTRSTVESIMSAWCWGSHTTTTYIARPSTLLILKINSSAVSTVTIYLQPSSLKREGSIGCVSLIDIEPAYVPDNVWQILAFPFRFLLTEEY